MYDSLYKKYRSALQNQPVVSLCEERIVDGQTAMGMLSHLQAENPLYMLERTADGTTVIALDPYLTMTCDAHRTRTMCFGQAAIGPAVTARAGLAALTRRFGGNRAHAAAGIFGLISAAGTARWMVPQAVILMQPHRDRVTVVRHVFAESCKGGERAAYERAKCMLNRLVTWISAPTYVKPLSVAKRTKRALAAEAGHAEPLHIYRYLRRLMPAKTTCFVHEIGYHLLGVDGQAVLTTLASIDKRLRAAAKSSPAYAVVHATLKGKLYASLPAGALRIEQTPRADQGANLSSSTLMSP